MTAILILRNGQRLTVRGVSMEYIDTLTEFRILAGYIISGMDWTLFP